MTDRVLVLGGYGAFGRLISEQLVARGVPICIAGRDLSKAEALASELVPANVTTLKLDAQKGLKVALHDLAPRVLVHTAGPFQDQDYAVAQTCIDLGIHYIDLADSRDFVCAIDRLDAAARAAGVSVVSGASTVPALSSAVLDSMKPEFARMDRLRYGIAPGQRTPRGRATAEAILGYAGRPIAKGGPQGQQRHGWGELFRHRFPALGKRWMGSCEAPDLDLFSQHYGLRDIRFSAGMEMAPVHLGLWALAGLVRLGVPLNLRPLAPALLWLADLFNPFGSNDGGMFMEVGGLDLAGVPLQRSWHLEIFDGHGPLIPTVPAVLLAERLLRKDLPAGARPCIGLISLTDYLGALPQDHMRVTAV